MMRVARQAVRPTGSRLRGLAVLLSVLAATLLATPAPVTQAGGAMRSVAFPTRTMGTYAGVLIVTRDSVAAAPAAARAHRAFQRVDSLMSNWTTSSEVARLNRVAGNETTLVQPEVAHVLEAALRIGRESDGAFDITVEPLVRAWGFLGGSPRVPSNAEVAEAFERVGAWRVHFDYDARTLHFERPDVRIDLGGIAKGHAVDEAALALQGAGIENALVDISGNMVALGTPAGAAHWRIGLRDPRDRLPYFARLELGSEAIATSGTYEQFVAKEGRKYGHILDPRSGRPAVGLISVTVVAGNAMTADAWGTALFALGPADAMRLAAERGDISAVLVIPGEGVDTVRVERALLPRFHLEEAASAFVHVTAF